jgi:hypothetical protein
MPFQLNQIKFAVATLVAGGAVLLSGSSAQAQVSGVGTEADSAVRAAYSTISVGGSTHSVAFEVIMPNGVYSQDGQYVLQLEWTNGSGPTSNPDQALLSSAVLLQGQQDNTGALTQLSAGTGGAANESSFVTAVKDAINSAVGDGQYENAEAIIEKFVGADGADVILD